MIWAENRYTYPMKIYIAALLVAIALLAAHLAGLDGWYFNYFWYDTMMHLLGGVGIGLFAWALLASFRSGMYLRTRNVIVMVIVVGLVWEYFEIHFQLTGHPLWTKWYYIDTVKDIINDTVGGAVVAYFSRRAS